MATPRSCKRQDGCTLHDLTLARVEPFPRAKARKLVDLAAQHELMPAFDRRPITLALIARESIAHKSILSPSLADSHIWR